MANGVIINQGTNLTIHAVENNGTSIGIVKLDIGSGTAIQDFGGTLLRLHDLGTLGSVGAVGVIHNAGTLAAGDNNIGNVDVVTGTVTLVTSVANLVKGTITKLEGGTLAEVTAVKNPTAGDLNTTVFGYDGATQRAISTDTGGILFIKNVSTPAGSSVLSHGTLGTAGGSFFATISALSGAGTKHFVTNVDIVMQAGTADVRVLAGTGIQGTGVIAAGKFPEGGGIAKHFQPAFDAGANSVLTYHFVGAGTAFITVNYFKSV